jgi:hypothetical protein
MSLVSYTEREMGGKSAVRAKDVHAAVTWEVPHAGGQVHPGKIRHDCRTKLDRSYYPADARLDVVWHGGTRTDDHVAFI